MAELTPTEFQVIRLLALGKTYEQVAAEMGTGRMAVGNHRMRVGARHGGGALVDILRELGWPSVPDHMSASDGVPVPSSADRSRDSGTAPARSIRRAA